MLDAPIVRLLAPTPSNIVLLPEVKSRSVKPVRAVSKLSVTLPEVPPPLRLVPALTAVISPTDESEPAPVVESTKKLSPVILLVLGLANTAVAVALELSTAPSITI